MLQMLQISKTSKCPNVQIQVPNMYQMYPNVIKLADMFTLKRLQSRCHDGGLLVMNENSPGGSAASNRVVDGQVSGAGDAENHRDTELFQHLRDSVSTCWGGGIHGIDGITMASASPVAPLRSRPAEWRVTGRIGGRPTSG